MKKYYFAMALALTVAGTCFKLAPKAEPVGAVKAIQTTDGIMQWDPDDVHYWLVQIKPGTEPGLTVLDDYADAADCYAATMYNEAGTAEQARTEQDWRACVPLDEPAELFLSQHIVGRVAK